MLPGGDIAKGFVCHLRWPELRVCGGAVSHNAFMELGFEVPQL